MFLSDDFAERSVCSPPSCAAYEFLILEIIHLEQYGAVYDLYSMMLPS